jgi:hypothetical protein
MDQVENKKARKIPCDLDHNGECLVCDCWISDCAFKRWIKEDYKWETEDELTNMFDEYKKEDYEDYLHGSNY